MKKLFFILIIISSVVQGVLLEPATGILAGVNLDYAEFTSAEFNSTTKIDHAFFVVFTGWPPDYNNLSQKVEQISHVRAALVVTPMPWHDPYEIPDSEINEFAKHISDYVYDFDVPVLVRFAHEMNGDWYPY